MKFVNVDWIGAFNPSEFVNTPYVNLSCTCKQILQNNLIDWIKNHNGIWKMAHLIICYASIQGKQFIVSLTEAIWYIDMWNHKKFKEQSYHISEISPKCFDHAIPESYKQSLTKTLWCKWVVKLLYHILHVNSKF